MVLSPSSFLSSAKSMTSILIFLVLETDCLILQVTKKYLVITKKRKKKTIFGIVMLILVIHIVVNFLIDFPENPESKFNSFYMNNLLKSNRKINKMHLLTDAFSLDRDFDYTQNLGAKPENQASKKPDFEYNFDDSVSLIKASDYVCKDSKLINDAFYPRRRLKAIKKDKVNIKGNSLLSLVVKSDAKRDESPENELKVRRMRAYDDALAMLRSVRAIPEHDGIKLRVKSNESPKREHKDSKPTLPLSGITSPFCDNSDLTPMMNSKHVEASKEFGK